ncbi:hypothetical protein PAPYR_9491 [Paratrimastix pyriformis]|uniref:Uncharacterized protein n=1 Tax=Paratrimastix pyriformis TaxID=342808 RepID=A0ABQ8U892_9EUKA|nr:hypothetical protein PAPYR_9491 [Paratrimastix pyriformis]
MEYVLKTPTGETLFRVVLPLNLNGSTNEGLRITTESGLAGPLAPAQVLVGLLSRPDVVSQPAAITNLLGAVAVLCGDAATRAALCQAGIAAPLVGLLASGPEDPALIRELLRAIITLADAPECRPALVQAGAAPVFVKMLAAFADRTTATAAPALAELLLRLVALFATPDDQPALARVVDALVAQVPSKADAVFDDASSPDPIPALTPNSALALMATDPMYRPSFVRATSALVRQLTVASADPGTVLKLLRAIAHLAATPECRPALMEAGAADLLAGLLTSNPSVATGSPGLAKTLIWAAASLADASPEIGRLLAAECFRAGSLLSTWISNCNEPWSPPAPQLIKALAALGPPRFRLHPDVAVLTMPLPESSAPPPVRPSIDILHLLEGLPAELLGILCAASEDPLRTYLTLIGLSHRLRAALRGTPTELAFMGDPDRRMEVIALIPTTDALAAIVGPCRGLRRLALQIPLYEFRTPESVEPPARLDEAFAGHDQLATLELPVAGPFQFQQLVPRILGHLPALRSLHVAAKSGSIDLAPVAAQLTHFTGTGSNQTPCLPALHNLHELRLSGDLPAGLMAALSNNKDTLGSLSLEINDFDEVNRLVAALAAMPHLTRLELESDPATCLDLCNVLPPLLPSLQHLSLRTGFFFTGTHPVPAMVQLNSPCLRTLLLMKRGSYRVNGQSVLALDCPALEELALPAGLFSRLELRCPMLRSFEGPAQDPAKYHLQCCASNLVRVGLHTFPGSKDRPDHTAAWLAAAPRLRQYRSDALCPAPDALWASRTLTRLRVRLPVAAFPLRLPPQLARLKVDINDSTETPAGMLAVAGPGLRFLTMRSGPQYCRLSFDCPALEVLRLEMPRLRAFRMEDGTAPPPLRSLAIGLAPRHKDKALDLDPAPLLDFLSRHGAMLQSVSLPPFNVFPGWPQLAAVLGRLPRLTVLRLSSLQDGLMALACPHLRQLILKHKQASGMVVLDCPALSCLSVFS